MDANIKQVELLARMQAIQSVTAFASIAQSKLKQLAEQSEELSIPEDTQLFAQGDKAEVCYIILSGEVEISIRTEEGKVIVLAELEANAIIGESALMMDDLRNATARTLLPTKLLKIDKALFKDLMQQEETAAEALMELQLKRSRPVKTANIEVYRQQKADGSEFIILRNTQEKKYYPLSEQGFFIWELLDGESSINDIALKFLLKFQLFNVEDIANHIIRLHKAGFARLDHSEKTIKAPEKIPGWLNFIAKIRGVMEYKIAFGQADEWITRVYQRFAWIFYTKLALIGFFLITVVGFVSFLAHFHQGISLLAASPYKWPLFFLQLFAVALTVPFHELAHAFTTKHFGRKVHCFGLGWLWFGPFAFCDTSDMWLSSARQRVIVDLVGIYLNLIFAGLAGLCLFLSFPAYPELTVFLVLFALSSYLFALANLDTAFELDGYYALMDYFDKPNLRQSAIKWLTRFFSKDKDRAHFSWKNCKTHYKEALYWLSALFSIIVLGTVIPILVLTYLLKGLLGFTAHPLLRIFLTLLAVTFASLSLYKDLITASHRD